jgi:hypothetical protein
LRANPALSHCPDCGAEIDIPAVEPVDPPAVEAMPAAVSIEPVLAEPSSDDFTGTVDAPSTPGDVVDPENEATADDNAQTEAAFEQVDAVADSEDAIFEDAGNESALSADLEPALRAIDAEHDELAQYDTAEPLPELEAQSAEGVSESLAETAVASTPSFLATATVPIRPRAPRWHWIALVALALLLGLQSVLADRARLAADAGWRPLLSTLCGVFGCELPAWREPQAFAMLSRDVRPATDAPGTLLVQATFRNDARWTQAWPVLYLSLSDADGRVVGARAFTATEYLGRNAAQAGLAPGQSAQVALRLHEPTTPVVAFSFEFR